MEEQRVMNRARIPRSLLVSLIPKGGGKVKKWRNGKDEKWEMHESGIASEAMNKSLSCDSFSFGIVVINTSVSSLFSTAGLDVSAISWFVHFASGFILRAVFFLDEMGILAPDQELGVTRFTVRSLSCLHSFFK